MEAQPRTCSSSSSVAYPRWVMLEQLLDIMVEDSSCSPTEGDDPNTMAAACTSAGHPIQVSFRFVEPPALSHVFLRIPEGLQEEKSKVLTVRGDSVLIKVRIKEMNQDYYKADYFVYNAGAAAADPPRPPLLFVLPPDFSDLGLMPPELSHYSTGLLRRGEDALVVAVLMNRSILIFGDDLDGVELYLFRSGEWNYYDIKTREDWDLPLLWDAVVPIDDRLLCWVDLSRDVILLDVFKETPTVQYLRLPMDPYECWESNWSVCATAGSSALKFVNISPQCCCGGTSASGCGRSCHTWMLRTLRMDADMEWVKDGMVDSTELRVLDACKDLPCAPLDHPIVSMDEPEIIYFRMRDHSRQIMVNLRSKTIQSVSHHENEAVRLCEPQDKIIPSNVSNFFNTYPSNGGGDGTLPGQYSQFDIERPSSNPTLEQPSGFTDRSSVHAALLEMS